MLQDGEKGVAMSSMLIPHGRSSTQMVELPDRIGFWEAHSATHLVGLRCSTHAPDGLHASAVHYDLGGVQLTDIEGNQHVIERPTSMLSTHPKNALFACLLLQGSAFFFQRDVCTLVQPGDIIMYSTSQAYLYGFSTTMRQIIIECDAGELLGEQAAPSMERAIHVARSCPRSGQMLVALKSAVLGFINDPSDDKVNEVSWLCRSALHMLATNRPLDPSGAGAWRLHQAQTYILDNLSCTELSMEEVARSQAISVRHLQRLFEPCQASPGEWMWTQRILRAEQKMKNFDSGRIFSIGALAYELGFSNPSHFSRMFRRHFQMSPSEYRKQVLQVKAG